MRAFIAHLHRPQPGREAESGVSGYAVFNWPERLRIVPNLIAQAKLRRLELSICFPR